MESALDMYRNRVTELPACDSAFLTEAMARYRAGDESAARDISGRCLGLALRLAEEVARKQSSVEIIDAIQEANRGLWLAITTFSGNDLPEFISYAQERIQERLTVLE
jgi:DNA-directed RNA polymerase specialized sigma subunit